MKGAGAEDFMRRAFELARAACGRVEPNPMVGAVVVQDGNIVGEGRHESYGGPHAEIAALAAAGAAARGSDIFVSLEPCCSTGKTPPCTEALIAAAPARVIYSAVDPDPRHVGRARRILEAAGIVVEEGLLAAEGEALLSDFRRHLGLGRSLVVAKWAASLDGRIATRTGESKWLTGEPARRLAHEERARSEGILVGIGTVLADDPRLDARLVGGRAPRPVILDSSLRLPAQARLIPGRSPLVFALPGRFAPERRAELEALGCEVVLAEADARGPIDLGVVLRETKRRGIHRLMVEGGGRILGSFFASGLVDLAQVFTAPVVIGDDEAHAALAGPELAALGDAMQFEFIEHRSLGRDLFSSLRLRATS